MHENRSWSRCLRLAALLVGLSVFACTPPATPEAGARTTVTAATSKPEPSASWEQKWANIVAEGKKEGSVTIYFAAWGPATRTALTAAIQKKFGIELNLVVFGRGAEMATRIQTEKLAGLNLVDVIAVGAGTIYDMKSAGLIGDMEPILLLPEVTDPNLWGGRLPFTDKDRKTIGMVLQTQRIMYNTDLVKKSEITSYKDLLKPQYKGKIIVGDPSIGGAANNLFTQMALSIWNPEETRAFFRELLTRQEAVVSRDSRLLVETVAKGKYAISLAPSPTVVKEFLKAGAPIDVAIAKEGTSANMANGTIALPATRAHPRATTVFVNWLLTKEGQTIFARNQDSPSIRIDVPTEGIEPRFVPQPGEKVFQETEESALFASSHLQGVLGEVIREAGK